MGIKDEQLDLFICESAFATLTNVNFDPDTLIEYINKSAKLRDILREKVRSAGGYVGFHGPVDMLLEKTKEGLIRQGKQVGIKADPSIDPDLNGLHWLLIYGLKGVAAYAYHAYLLGKKDDKVFEFIQQGFAATLDKSLGVNDFVNLALKMWRNQHQSNGTIRRWKHRNLRSSNSYKSSAWSQERQSNSGFRSRFKRFGRSVGAKRGQRHLLFTHTEKCSLHMATPN